MNSGLLFLQSCPRKHEGKKRGRGSCHVHVRSCNWRRPECFYPFCLFLKKGNSDKVTSRRTFSPVLFFRVFAFLFSFIKRNNKRRKRGTFCFRSSEVFSTKCHSRLPPPFICSPHGFLPPPPPLSSLSLQQLLSLCLLHSPQTYSCWNPVRAVFLFPR